MRKFMMLILANHRASDRFTDTPYEEFEVGYELVVTIGELT